MTRLCELALTDAPHSSGSWQVVVSQMASPRTPAPELTADEFTLETDIQQ